MTVRRHSGAVLLHLDGGQGHVQGPGGQEAGHQGLVPLRVHVVQVGFQDQDPFPEARGRSQGRPQVEAQEVGVARQVPAAGAVAHRRQGHGGAGLAPGLQAFRITAPVGVTSSPGRSVP